LGGVFYSVKEKGYSKRDRRVTELEFNKRMEIEAQMAVDRERAAAEKVAEEERNDPARRRTEVEVGGKTAVRRPAMKPRGKVGGLTASSSSRPAANGAANGAGRGGGSGGSVVKRPSVRRRPGAF
jgi:pre-mRNA-splicing factor ATP-dependent RNA helicase DHX38/PRP16